MSSEHSSEIHRTSVKMITITEHQHGQRVDNFLMAQFRSLPKSKIYQMIRKGEVRVNKGRVKPETRLKQSDVIRLPPVNLAPESEASAPRYLQEKLLNSIIHEDQNVLVINKPSGVAVHRGSGLDTGVIECLRVARPDLDYLELVHRLDRETSGCLIMAKNGRILRLIQQAEMDKRYLCLVKGKWSKGIYDHRAKLDIENRAMGERHVIVSDQGKSAHTRFSPVESYAAASLLEAKLFTGRTHQIRVHAADLHHPLAGDQRYGDELFNQVMKKKGLNRLFLHAHSLMLDVDHHSYAFSAPLPDDLHQVLTNLST